MKARYHEMPHHSHRFISTGDTLLQLILLVEPPAEYIAPLMASTDMDQLKGIQFPEYDEKEGGGFNISDAQHIKPGKKFSHSDSI